MGFSFLHSREAAPEPRGKKPSANWELGKEARDAAGASLQRPTESHSFPPRDPSLVPSTHPARNVAPNPDGFENDIREAKKIKKRKRRRQKSEIKLTERIQNWEFKSMIFHDPQFLSTKRAVFVILAQT